MDDGDGVAVEVPQVKTFWSLFRLTFVWLSTDVRLSTLWISTCGSPGDQAESIRGGGGGRRLLTWDALEEKAGQSQCCSRHGGCHVLLGFLCLGEGTNNMYCLKPASPMDISCQHLGDACKLESFCAPFGVGLGNIHVYKIYICIVYMLPTIWGIYVSWIYMLVLDI